MHEVLRSPGEPLDDAARAYFEPRFRHDFSGVRVHTDHHAEQSANAIKANAYTAGHDIVFGLGRFDFNATDGRRLLAHELTHVVQQSAEDAPRAIARQPTDATHRGQDAKPKAPKCDAGLALRWGQDTSRSGGFSKAYTNKAKAKNGDHSTVAMLAPIT